jgi:hypothetical protein
VSLNKRRSLAHSPWVWIDVEQEALPLAEIADPERSTAEILTNASAGPSSGWIKPKPFAGLNHFTPIDIWKSVVNNRVAHAWRIKQLSGRYGAAVIKTTETEGRPKTS